METHSTDISMQSRVGLWGGSCAIRLPKIAVESLGLHEGETVSLYLKNGELVVRPSRQRYSLSDLVEDAKKLVPPDVLDDPAIGDEAL